VYALNKGGFDAFGVDFAKETVSEVKKHWPHLKIFKNDLRKLPFEDGYFDGYWSCGVIEHFYKGYDDILTEMNRVIKKGGFLFLTYPRMSLLRKTKALLGLFPKWQEDSNKTQRFYQFALNNKSVIKIFESNGFELIKKHSRGSLKELQEEVKFLNKIISNFTKKMPKIATLFAIGMDLIPFIPLGHTSLLIFRKN
jgi:ubiquinone/menaquinone biosynthesis C-methylase UbiE